ncbi:hypothetical protein [Cohnella lubricantis]|uniref:Uncharacterized protein n=1 Tax=Cohnella lubricantis TaxID=2163172 RepID=A0A841TGL4_9BACL|nr:hypothetical protein [Cohnella lubricantis]MBB6678370.1 hypothetical protein [Cohnella lubricantis]MBP2116750.1 hypothetical protein [Cohnella lubricantis]
MTVQETNEYNEWNFRVGESDIAGEEEKEGGLYGENRHFSRKSNGENTA